LNATPTIAERAAAILREEIADGALANIVTSSRMWSTHRSGLVSQEVGRRLRSDLEGLFDTLLDLLAPPATRPSREGITILRAKQSVAPGEQAEIRSSLRNDGPRGVDIGFLCSDLVAEPGERILADCIRLVPGRIRLSPGEVVDLAIGLAVPGDARPGVYHALLQATDLTGLRALLTFPVA
jgi:hypothetical protein